MAEEQIVVIEDEHLIAQAIASRLKAEGLAVHIAPDGRAGIEFCTNHRVDLVVLDIMLPGIDGLAVLERLRTLEYDFPVLILTARNTESDLVVGLDAGADDYMTKPFSPRELSARVRALLRRTNTSRGNEREELAVGSLKIDLARRHVSLDGKQRSLTPLEFELLVHLSHKPGVVFSRSQLLMHVWGYSDSAGERSIDSHVRSLRRKLGSGIIRTVYGVGYALAVEEADASA